MSPIKIFIASLCEDTGSFQCKIKEPSDNSGDQIIAMRQGLMSAF